MTPDAVLSWLLVGFVAVLFLMFLLALVMVVVDSVTSRWGKR